MNPFIATLYGLIQGLTEFLPVSSSGHLALLPKFINITDPGIFFDLMMHVGTAGAIIVYFHKRLISLFLALPSVFKLKVLDNGQVVLLRHFILSTVASVFFILLLKGFAKNIGRSPILIGLNLIIFGLIMYLVDKFSAKNVELGEMETKWSPKKALLIGVAQSLAIFPGVSRSGITLSAARLSGLNRLESSSYSFLLSLPIIVAGALAEVPKLLKTPFSTDESFSLFVGVFTSFIVGLLTIHFFLKIISKWSLFPFFIYRLILGLIVLFY